MSRFAWALSIVGPLLIVAWAALPFTPASGVIAQASVPATAPPVPPVANRSLGMGGCAAAACHGAPAADALSRPRNEWDGSEWSCSAMFWLAADPHTRAYAALDKPLAATIMERLNRGAPAPHLKATEDVRCLACHTNPGQVVPVAKGSRQARLGSDGVGCEGCHGNSSGWLHAHTNWQAADHKAEIFDKVGMTKLYDIGERALMCAGCHVGSPADTPIPGYPVRDMNHDMIAAGHPRLNFDFAEYQRRLPPHWLEKDRTKTGSPRRNADFEARAWLVGRVAHAEAACRLLISRANRIDDANERAPWPEFAESSCVSCHHTISDPDRLFPQPSLPSQRRAGQPQWQPIWPLTRVPDLKQIDGKAVGPLEELLTVIEVARPSAADAKTKAKKAADAFGILRGYLATAPMTEVSSRIDRVCEGALVANPEPLDWDWAAQVFQGLAAAERSRARKVDLTAFQDVQKKLSYPRPSQRDTERTDVLRFDVPKGIVDDLKKLPRK